VAAQVAATAAVERTAPTITSTLIFDFRCRLVAVWHSLRPLVRRADVMSRRRLSLSYSRLELHITAPLLLLLLLLLATQTANSSVRVCAVLSVFSTVTLSAT